MRNRFVYIALAIVVMLLGLATRHFSEYLPHWINLFLGDTLWALMVFLLFGLLLRNAETRWIAAIAITFSFGIEVSQLYHAQWIDSLRRTRLGGLVLGYAFLWSDLISYSLGIGMGILVDRKLIRRLR